MSKITTLKALNSLQDETIVYAVIVCVAAISLSFLVASLVPYKGGKDRSYITRRIWCIIIGIVACISFYLYNDLAVKPNINNLGWQNMFSHTNLISTGIIFGGYIVLCVVLMLCFRHSKFGSILGKAKD